MTITMVEEQESRTIGFVRNRISRILQRMLMKAEKMESRK